MPSKQLTVIRRVCGYVFAIGVSVIFASACAHTLGYAGAHPGEVECKGKATVSGNGAASAGAGIGGSELNHFTITFDCGDGAYLRQGRPASSAPPAINP